MRTFLALAAAALLAAAAPAQRAVGSAYAQQAQALRELQYQVQTLAARFDAIEQRQSSLAARIAALERGSGDSGLASKDEVAAPRSDLAAVRSAQGRLRDEIVEDLSARISAIAKRQEQARAAEARERQAERQRSGYSHTVEAGQTLSAIALAYKVSVKAIMQANNITDPTKLACGADVVHPRPIRFSSGAKARAGRPFFVPVFGGSVRLSQGEC